MGCSSSSPKVSPASHGANTEELLIRDMIVKVVDEDPLPDLDYRGKIAGNFEKIISGVKSIANPKQMKPIFCFSNDAFPIICCGIQIENQYYFADQIDRANSGIIVPIISASNGKNGKAVCISQLQFLSQNYLATGSTTALILNAFNWISNGSAMNSLIYVHSPHFEFIEKGLKKIGISCKQCFNFSSTDFTQARILILTTDSEIDNQHDQIQLISSKGCGIVILYSEFTSNINALLQNYGLAFSNIILNVDRTVENPIVAQQMFSCIKDVNFPSLYMRLLSLLMQNKVDFSTLDDTIAAIRYYFDIATQSQLPQIEKIIEKSLDFLKRTQYKNSDSICSTACQKLIVIFLQLIFDKIPLSLLPSIDCNDLLYLQEISFDAVDTEVTVNIRNMHWTTTGLWLQPNTIGSICITTPIDEHIFIQIGSHSQNLFELKNEWKRWPFPIITTQVTSQSEIQLKSPFGGIIYITWINSDIEIQTKEITFQAKGMSIYPRYSYKDQNILSNTKDSSIPWAEIETEYINFTLPSLYFKKINDFSLFDDINKNITNVCNNISMLLSSNELKQHQARIVFDVQLIENKSVAGYPIFDLVSNVDSILIESFQKQPTVELLNIFCIYSLLFIKEGVFENDKEMLFAQFIAITALKTVFAKFNLKTFQPLDHSLDILLKINAKFAGSVMKSFQNVVNEPVSDLDANWIQFLTDLSKREKRNFFLIFDLVDRATKEIKKFSVFDAK